MRRAEVLLARGSGTALEMGVFGLKFRSPHPAGLGWAIKLVKKPRFCPIYSGGVGAEAPRGQDGISPAGRGKTPLAAAASLPTPICPILAQMGSKLGEKLEKTILYNFCP